MHYSGEVESSRRLKLLASSLTASDSYFRVDARAEGFWRLRECALIQSFRISYESRKGELKDSSNPREVQNRQVLRATLYCAVSVSRARIIQPLLYPQRYPPLTRLVSTGYEPR
jgi:hypothetical protein